MNKGHISSIKTAITAFSLWTYLSYYATIDR
jgi:hypothetical protein